VSDKQYYIKRKIPGPAGNLSEGETVFIPVRE
jgi:hypothetical protein